MAKYKASIEDLTTASAALDKAEAALIRARSPLAQNSKHHKALMEAIWKVRDANHIVRDDLRGEVIADLRPAHWDEGVRS